MTADSGLTQWRRDPFRLLQEMERRARARLANREAGDGANRQWVGVACRSGDQQLLVSRDDIREIMVVPPTTRVPGARSWIRGLANVRGQLLPLTDLSALGGGEPTSVGRSTRVVWVNHRSIPAGLLVDEVFGFRRFARSGRLSPGAEIADRPLGEFITSVFSSGDEKWPVINLQDVVESDVFLQAAEA